MFVYVDKQLMLIIKTNYRLLLGSSKEMKILGDEGNNSTF